MIRERRGRLDHAATADPDCRAPSSVSRKVSSPHRSLRARVSYQRETTQPEIVAATVNREPLDPLLRPRRIDPEIEGRVRPVEPRFPE